MTCCGKEFRPQALNLVNTLQRKGNTQEADELQRTVARMDQLMKRAERVLGRHTRPSGA